MGGAVTAVDPKRAVRGAATADVSNCQVRGAGVVSNREVRGAGTADVSNFQVRGAALFSIQRRVNIFREAIDVYSMRNVNFLSGAVSVVERVG